MRIRCIVVDDEPSGRKIIEEYISEVPFLELSGKAENPVKAFDLMQKHPVDLIFLDIQMPKLNGIEFLKSLRNAPQVILTTAFPGYALQGFDLDVADYLLKPVSFERFLKAVNKVKDTFNSPNPVKTTTDYFFVKCNSMYEKVYYNELLYVKAANNYVLLHTKNKRIITYLTFRGIEEMLPADRFIKVHKSFIVSLSKIETINGEEIKVDKYTIPVSRRMKDEVLGKVLGTSLLKR